jgi:hypothetical protein
VLQALEPGRPRAALHRIGLVGFHNSFRSHRSYRAWKVVYNLLSQPVSPKVIYLVAKHGWDCVREQSVYIVKRLICRSATSR